MLPSLRWRVLIAGGIVLLVTAVLVGAVWWQASHADHGRPQAQIMTTQSVEPPPSEDLQAAGSTPQSDSPSPPASPTSSPPNPAAILAAGTGINVGSIVPQGQIEAVRACEVHSNIVAMVHRDTPSAPTGQAVVQVQLNGDHYATTPVSTVAITLDSAGVAEWHAIKPGITFCELHELNDPAPAQGTAAANVTRLGAWLEAGYYRPASGEWTDIEVVGYDPGLEAAHAAVLDVQPDGSLANNTVG